MVISVRLERTTLSLKVRCSNQLSYETAIKCVKGKLRILRFNVKRKNHKSVPVLHVLRYLVKA